MDKRLQLHDVLRNILRSVVNDESKIYVYYDPPEGVKMSYPCIVYNRSRIDTDYADNEPYTLTKRYQVTVIYKDPDSPLPDKIAMLPKCRFDQTFTTDNLHHDVYTIVY